MKHILTEIVLCEKHMKNRSNKPAKRLRAAMAASRLEVLMAMLPGSTKRGIARGHVKLE